MEWNIALVASDEDPISCTGVDDGRAGEGERGENISADSKIPIHRW
jgi:hypothetical protein